MSATDQFLSAMEAAGLTPPDPLHADGDIHRFSPTGKRGDDAGWYVFHPDGVPAGVFGDWRSGESQTWCAKGEDELSDAERQAMCRRIKDAQRKRAAEEVRVHGESASNALAAWEDAGPAVAHPYLAAKGVKPYGVRMDGHRLLVPMHDATGKLNSLQIISPDGTKCFMPGGRVRACYHAIGKPMGRVFVCEGYATGATIHEAMGDAVAVAFSAGNLLPVAVALRAKYPSLEIIIAADDDWKTPENPGLSAARLAAQAVGGKVAVPDFTGLPRDDKDTDFNDLHQLAGAVRIGEQA
ncbi:hypothetical protein PMI12_01729 [Variovorax sp. CF313]|uniref:toprim domain-containing protein n=1 Tax=Variovorax sp. CF313 TaxID=1144315 RepID=UPI000270EB9B|nr:toprim domain-containing protein [Variovorax sp. CF313]EJL77466.1 hypothetical protein PMI12_01729 [Variovorax sp. CF313]